MKKIKYLMFVFLSVLCLTGCGKDKSKDEIKDALLKMKDTKAISMKVTVNMGSDEIKMPLSMEMSGTGNNVHMKYSMTVLGTTQEMMEMYMIEKDKELYNYIYEGMSGEGRWIYTKTPIENTTNTMTDTFNEIDEKKVEEYLNSFDTVKKVKSDKEGYQKYELTLSKKSMEESAKKEIEEYAIEQTKEDTLKEMEEIFKMLPDSFVFNMYLKDGELAYMTADFSSIDFSSMISDAMDDESMDGLDSEANQMMEMFKNFKVFDMTIEIVGRNDAVKVEVPKEVEESATLMESDLSLDDFDM